MANPNGNTNVNGGATTSAPLGPLHQLDDWLMPASKRNPDAQFAAAVVDVARGAKAIAGILASHLVDLNAVAGGAGESVRTLLSETETEALARLAIFSLGRLSEMAENRVDFLNGQAAGGQA